MPLETEHAGRFLLFGQSCWQAGKATTVPESRKYDCVHRNLGAQRLARRGACRCVQWHSLVTRGFCWVIELTKSPSSRGSFLMGTDPGVSCDPLPAMCTASQENRTVPLGCRVLGMGADTHMCATPRGTVGPWDGPSMARPGAAGTLSPQGAVLTDKEQEGRGNEAAVNQGWKRSLNWPHVLPSELTCPAPARSLRTWLRSVGSL